VSRVNNDYQLKIVLLDIADLTGGVSGREGGEEEAGGVG